MAKCKVKVICPLVGVFKKYQPEVGKIYDAEYRPAYKEYGSGLHAAVCLINVLDKKIALRKGEYEIMGDYHGQG